MSRFAMIVFGILLVLVPQLYGQDLLIESESIAFDSLYNRYLVSCWNGRNIIQIDSNGVQALFKDGIGSCRGNHIHDGVLYVSTDSHLRGLDLGTGNIVLNVELSAIGFLDGVAIDTSGNVYVVDTGGRIYRIKLSDQTDSIIVNSGLSGWPQDIYFDAINNRLLLVSWGSGPILSIDPTTLAVTSVVSSPIGSFDGITMDQFGNVYVATHNYNGLILKYNNDFFGLPDSIPAGCTSPAGIDYNTKDHILAVPCFDSHEVKFIDLKVQISSDINQGQVPFEVHFEGNSILEGISSWNWNFGDGLTDTGQNVSHEYQDFGQYDVSLKIKTDEAVYSRTEQDLVIALADTLAAIDVQGDPGSTVEVVIYGRNTIPVDRIRIPIAYRGQLYITLDSFTAAGCRTYYFDNIIQTDFDPINRVTTFTIYNNSGGSTPYLEPGTGPVLRLFFKIPSSAAIGQISSISLDGYSSYRPEMRCELFKYTPICESGVVSLPGICGDVNDDGSVNILDIIHLIAYLYQSGPPPVRMNLGDPNADCTINILDVSALINILYLIGPAPLEGCVE